MNKKQACEMKPKTNSKTGKVIDSEYISGSFLYDYFSSQEFIRQLVEATTKTRDTGREHGFVTQRLFKQRIITLPITEGTESEIDLSDSYSHATVTRNDYQLLDLHCHHINCLPTPNDLLSTLQGRIFAKVCGWNVKLISSVGCGVNGRDDLIALALYQQKDSDESIEYILKRMHKDCIRKRDAGEKLGDEEFEELYHRIILPHYNIGIAIYSRESDQWELMRKAANSYYIPNFNTTIDELLSKFAFQAEKIPIDPSLKHLDIYSKEDLINS
ncbi:MAG: hypothetical protein KAU20_03645 [Nanoarchaeota archaeon]|nr:hypothetical protein [Nanoarchaeota archaeon]